MYWVTSAGLAGRCGNSEPGTAATASSSSRNSAVRMLVSWVQAQRSMPNGPSAGMRDSLGGGFAAFLHAFTHQMGNLTSLANQSCSW